MLRTASMISVAGVLALALTATPAAAHTSGCHTAHSCPSDHHSYVWYDSTGQGWSCARPGSDTYNAAWDTTLITYAGLPYYCHEDGSAPPPPAPAPAPLPALPEPAPIEPESTERAPTARVPVYMGTFRFVRFAAPEQGRPRELHPFSADDGAYLYSLRWRSWGQPRARARGKASVNTCDPYCAVGKRVRRRGAKATAYRLRDGSCDGEPARFYTRALIRFPKVYRIAPMTLKLRTRCD